LSGRDTNRDDQREHGYDNASLRSPLELRSTFERSHSRKLRYVFAASATRRKDSGTKERWT
jgi:hypothetical protein